MLHCDILCVRNNVFVHSFQGEMDLKIALSGIPRHLEVCHLIQAFIPDGWLSSYSVYLTHSLLCFFPRLCASGPGRSSLHPGSAFSASYSGACVQTEAECPFKQTYVLLICTNKHTHTHSFPCPCYGSNINLSHWVPRSVLSDTYFLSIRWIDCISHSGKHIHTPSVVFRSVSIHSQWPISRFLSPRCTRAGEDGQVSFPTVCQAAGFTDQLQTQLLFKIIILCTWIFYFVVARNISYTKGSFSGTTWLDQNVLQHITLHYTDNSYELVFAKDLHVALRHQ